MDAIYNTFFNVLNQLILVGLTLLGTEGSLWWLSLPFGLLLVGFNFLVIRIWRRSGFSRAAEFYAEANRICFFVLAVSGLIIAGGFTVAQSIRSS
jgi:hypothetical protein